MPSYQGQIHRRHVPLQTRLHVLLFQAQNGTKNRSIALQTLTGLTFLHRQLNVYVMLISFVANLIKVIK